MTSSARASTEGGISIDRRNFALDFVARVDRIGSVEREIRVGLDPVRLQSVGLTPLDVSRQLRSSNVDLAGGRAEIGGRDQAIRTLAGAKTIADLAATRIALPAGGEVQLDDLGLITDTIAEPRTFARFDGAPVVGFSILRAKGASDVVLADAVAARIDAIKAANPTIDLKLIDTSVTHTLGNYELAMHTLYEGAILAMIVVFLFLRDWRATIITAVILPLSFFPAFWVMQLLGFSLNVVSVLAITLSTGILVDDAIVEIENIVRHIRMGKSPYQAALEAADEIGLAVIAISLALVAVFIPASFMPSIPGQFFKQFGITVSVQVLFSLLCARMITPMLAAYFLRPHHHEEKGCDFASSQCCSVCFSSRRPWQEHPFCRAAFYLLQTPPGRDHKPGQHDWPEDAADETGSMTLSQKQAEQDHDGDRNDGGCQ